MITRRQKSPSSRRQLSLLFLLILQVLFLCIHPVDAYANWLKCYVDLDETEVVMNHHIVPLDQASHQVGLLIQPHSETHVHNNNKDDWMETIQYPRNQVSKWRVKLDIPKDLEGHTLQFVVEVAATGTTNDDAQFLHPKLCQGRRAFGRSYDEYVILEVGGRADRVELWAGWAPGYAPVSLTSRMVLLLADEASMEEDEPEEL